MTRFLICALIASEFAATAGWHMLQYKLHHRRRASDIMSSLMYSLLAVSYFAYGTETMFFDISSNTGYIADGLVALTLGFFVIRRLVLGIKASKRSTTNK
jgi:hypothetical protein